MCVQHSNCSEDEKIEMLLASSHLCQLLTAGEHCEENLGEPSSCQVTADLRSGDTKEYLEATRLIPALILDVMNISRASHHHHRHREERLCVSCERDGGMIHVKREVLRTWEQ